MDIKPQSRIPIDLVRVDMIIAQDVIDFKGIILIPKNTVINEKHIFKLKMYEVLSVVIFDEEQEFNDNTEYTVKELNKKQKEVILTSEIQTFSHAYSEALSNVTKAITDIANGDKIYLKRLYRISEEIINQFSTKTTLFNSLYLLPSTEEYVFSHSLNVSLLCNVFGKWLNLPQRELEELTVAGLLHDIGKTKIDKSIINKPGKLTNDEFNRIKHHTIWGYEILKDRPIAKEIKLAALMHHEKINGSGYPFGILEEKITKFSKIIAICDIYDAMTSDRSYHEKFSPFKVIQMFEEESYGLLDISFLYIFLENIAHNYIGCNVELTNGQHGKIIFVNPQLPSKPLIQLQGKVIDLSKEKDIFIEDIL